MLFLELNKFKRRVNEEKIYKISVITVCRNVEKCIQETMETVLGQTYDNIEYILIDGNSTDKTVDISQHIS